MSTLGSALKLVEREIHISAPWGKVAALTWGDSKNPAVVLCHGKLDVASGFRPLVSLLPTSFFYVSVDLPGNGKSDKFPKDSRFTVVDFVPTIERLQRHFKWNSFMYIGHSLGVVIGKYFNLAYPGVITRMVELDPVPAYWTCKLSEFASWYHLFYGEFYSDEKYRKLTGGNDTAPKYTYERALHLMMNTRGLTKEASQHVLERCLEPAGDGLYRFNYDQRLKEVPRLPWSGENLRELYTSITTPTFTILADNMIKMGLYDDTPFIQDISAWPNKNYKYKIVKGNHDAHITEPECMAEDISEFLLYGLKAKL